MKTNTISTKTLWSKDFIFFIICTAQSALGASISGVALSFLVLKLTGSASDMAITLAFNFLPNIFTPFLATIIDRHPLKPPMISGLLVRGAILIGIYIGINHGMINIYGIYLMAFITGTITAFYGPASQSLIPQLIPCDQLQRGNSILGTANSTMSLVGLYIGGLLVAAFGPQFALFIEGLCYIISGFLLIFVVMPKHAAATLTNSFGKDFVLGLETIKKSKILILIIAMMFLINTIMSPMGVLMPIHMTAIGKGASGYGTFMALSMVGMLLGNVIIAGLGKRFESSKGVFISWIGITVALVGLNVLNAFYVSLVWAVLLGISAAMLNTSVVIILQEIVAVTLRARVFGSVTAIAQIGIPLSLLVLSYVVTKITIGEIFIIGAGLACAFAIIWYVNYYKRTMIGQTTEIQQ